MIQSNSILSFANGIYIFTIKRETIFKEFILGPTLYILMVQHNKLFKI